MTDAPAPGARSQLLLEWLGVVTAIAYSLLVASNTGFEFLGFVLLFISSLAIGLWAHRGLIGAYCSCNSSMPPRA